MCSCETKDNLQLNVSVGSCHSTVPILWLGLAMKNTWLRSTKHCGLAENTCFGRHRDVRLPVMKPVLSPQQRFEIYAGFLLKNRFVPREMS